MKQLLIRLAIALAATSFAHAHFVFVVPQEGGTSARVILSEDLQPDPAIDAELVASTKLILRDSAGKDSALTLVRNADGYAVPTKGSGTHVIHGFQEVGITGEVDKPYLLLYHPKTILGNAFDTKVTIGGQVPLEIIPQGKSGSMRFKVLAQGKPLADAEVTVILPDGKLKPVKTDSAGLTESFSMIGRYGVWTRLFETSAGGERGGKKFGETHHYATLVAEVTK